MNLSEYRNSIKESARISDLMALLPINLNSAIDIGARDGFLSKELTNHFDAVTALDLELPEIEHPRITCIQGNATALQFKDASFDLVLCAEVLEHIPSPALELACKELARVSNGYVLIGVPYRQDIRHDQTTCYSCGGTNPPWAHVNSFDEKRLHALFPDLKAVATTYIGQSEMGTNFISTYLMDKAGNPFGTYEQEEGCVHCEQKLKSPPARTLAQKLMTRSAHYIRKMQVPFTARHANWIHILFKKREI